MFNLGGLQRTEPVVEQARVFRSEPELEPARSHLKLSLVQFALRVDHKSGTTGGGLVVLDASPAKVWGPSIIVSTCKMRGCFLESLRGFFQLHPCDDCMVPGAVHFLGFVSVHSWCLWCVGGCGYAAIPAGGHPDQTLCVCKDSRGSSVAPGLGAQAT